MNPISFVTANFVARELDYQNMERWQDGEIATNAYFRPLGTYSDRFHTLIRSIHLMGFRAVDLWIPHLNPAWATATHLEIAKQVLGKYKIVVTSLSGDFGNTPDEFAAVCREAVQLNCHILGGRTPLLETDRTLVEETLHRYRLKLAIENHPEKDPREMLDLIGDGAQGAIGTTIDTGWWATQGVDPVAAVEQLHRHTLMVHLKDIKAIGFHDTCAYGQGIVPVEKVMHALQQFHYEGPIGIEHEPEDHDPTEDVMVSLGQLNAWIQRGSSHA